jgi:hypothetical protein|uniref:Uncharacterized protein n=1 Tax=Myoviridae sp. ctkmZ20 TaxID=2825166 RepID=A0A8S5NU12_9CAUD|nr:MAG TPA: Protein of unknown function (DUF1566) [Myoviridae sp. ctkmZ20]
MAIKTRKISDWLSANGQVITNASAASMKTYLEQNLRPLQDGVYIGKRQNDGWGSQSGGETAMIGSYMRIESWQTTSIGISSADADAIVIQHGGYRLGIALSEPSAEMKWGSVQNSGSIGYQQSSDLNTFDGITRTSGIMASSYYKNDDPAYCAVAYCWNYMTKRTEGDKICQIGKHNWWLPTMGDLALIHRYFETINLALLRIRNAGKQSVDLLKRTAYWSCVEDSGYNAWTLRFDIGYRYTNGKVASPHRVRPVTAF